MPDVLLAKKTYRIQHKLEAFYSGGTARVTRDGKLVACACGDEVKIVELSTGAVTRTLAGDSEPITSLAVSPDSKTLFAASRSLQCKTYDLASGATLRTWRGHKAPVADATFDPSAGYIATASADRSVKVWDVKGGFATHNFVGHSGVVMAVVWHPRQMQLFSAGDDAEVRVWDLVDKSCVAVFKGHFSAVTSLSLSPDGWLLLSGGRDKVVHVWDIRSKAKVATVPVYEAVEGVVSLPLDCGLPGVTAAAQPLGKKAVFFATAGEKGVVRLWRSDTATCVYTQPSLSGAPADAVAAAALPAAGSEYVDVTLLPGTAGLLVCSADARLMVFSPEEVDGKLQLSLSRQLIGNHDEVTDVRFLGPPGEPTHLAVATNSEAVRLFRLSNLSCSASLLGHRDIVLCLDATALQGGRCLVASGSKDAEVRVWESPSGQCLGQGVGHIGAVSAVAFSRKASAPLAQRFLVSAGADKLLKVWELAQAASKEDGTGPVALKVLAAVAAHDKDINSVAIAPNDTLVATGSQDRTARVWRLPDLVPVVTLRGHRRGVWSVEFSPVDKALLTASGDKTIKLWNIVDGACLKTFEGHTASVLRATYVTAGTQVLSCGADGLVKLWGVRDSECLNTFDEHEDKIWALTSGGVGESLIATGGADALVAIWQDVTEEDLAVAEEREVELAGKEQDLRNALAANNFATAARLAFDLKHPGRLLAVLGRMAGTAGSGLTGSALSVLLSGLAAHLGPEDIKTALEYVREWNTNAKHCHAAHALLRAVLRHHAPDALLAVPGVREMLGGVLAYSQRHFVRMDRLVRSSFLLDYTLDCMHVLRDEAGGRDVTNMQSAAARDVALLDEAADGKMPLVGQGAVQGADGEASDDASASDGSGDEDMVDDDGGVEALRRVAGKASGKRGAAGALHDDDSGSEEGAEAEHEAVTGKGVSANIAAAAGRRGVAGRTAGAPSASKTAAAAAASAGGDDEDNFDLDSDLLRSGSDEDGGGPNVSDAADDDVPDGPSVSSGSDAEVDAAEDERGLEAGRTGGRIGRTVNGVASTSRGAAVRPSAVTPVVTPAVTPVANTGRKGSSKAAAKQAAAAAKSAPAKQQQQQLRDATPSAHTATQQPRRMQSAGKATHKRLAAGAADGEAAAGVTAAAAAALVNCNGASRHAHEGTVSAKKPKKTTKAHPGDGAAVSTPATPAPSAVAAAASVGGKKGRRSTAGTPAGAAAVANDGDLQQGAGAKVSAKKRRMQA